MSENFICKISITNLKFVFKVILLCSPFMYITVSVTNILENILDRNANKDRPQRTRQNFVQMCPSFLFCMLTDRRDIRVTTPAAEKRRTYLLHQL